MPVCKNCNAALTPAYTRVFGDNRNDVAGCLHCLPATVRERSEDA